MPELRVDPLTGDKVIVAAERASRWKRSRSCCRMAGSAAERVMTLTATGRPRFMSSAR